MYLPGALEFLHLIGSAVDTLFEAVEDVADKAMLAYQVKLAAHETCTNIIEHAYAGRSGDIHVKISLLAEPRRVVVELKDQGKNFELPNIQTPNLEEVQIRGYGLFLIHQLMDEVQYEPQMGSNHWRLTKRF